MNPKVAKVKDFVGKAYNIVSEKAKLTKETILQSALGKTASNVFNPINHKLWIIYVTIQLIDQKEIDTKIFNKPTEELYNMVSELLTTKKHKIIVSAILVATDYLIVKTMTKNVAKIVPNGIAHFTYNTLSGGLTYVLKQTHELKNAQGNNLKAKLINSLKAGKAKIKSISDLIKGEPENTNSEGAKYLNQMFGANPNDSSDSIRTEIGKLLFASAAVTAFAEETSKKIASQLKIVKFYLSLFNTLEVAYYVTKQRYSKNMKAVIIARLFTVVFHVILQLLHKTKYKNLTYIFHALFNIYSPILAIIISKKLK